jgi:hypothetical protein
MLAEGSFASKIFLVENNRGGDGRSSAMFQEKYDTSAFDLNPDRPLCRNQGAVAN